VAYLFGRAVGKVAWICVVGSHLAVLFVCSVVSKLDRSQEVFGIVRGENEVVRRKRVFLPVKSLI